MAAPIWVPNAASRTATIASRLSPTARSRVVMPTPSHAGLFVGSALGASRSGCCCACSSVARRESKVEVEPGPQKTRERSKRGVDVKAPLSTRLPSAET
jgi:hypothetical protein